MQIFKQFTDKKRKGSISLQSIQYQEGRKNTNSNTAQLNINANDNVSAQEVQRAEKRMYLDKKVTPVLSKMLIHVVNQKPKNLVQFMIQFLKGEEDKFQQTRFQQKPKNSNEENDIFRSFLLSTKVKNNRKF